MSKVTQRHLDLARSAGACQDGLKIRVGMPLVKVPRGLVEWVENYFGDDARRVAAELVAQSGLKVRGAPSLSLLIFSSGDGSGYGYGDGSGDGFGFGFGYGYGDGSGDGFGFGYGFGYGSGDGSGYG